MAEAERPEIIVLDIGLPDLNGYETAGRLREQAAEPQTVIVALTGWGQHADRQRSKDAGFNHHLLKPVELGDVLNVIEGRSVDQRR